MDYYVPKKKTEFWCSECDCYLVDSENPSSGHFYIKSGHMYNQATKEFDGTYTMVMFAICAHCEKKE